MSELFWEPVAGNECTYVVGKTNVKGSVGLDTFPKKGLWRVVRTQREYPGLTKIKYFKSPIVFHTHYFDDEVEARAAYKFLVKFIDNGLTEMVRYVYKEPYYSSYEEFLDLHKIAR